MSGLKSVLISSHYLPVREYISLFLEADVIYVHGSEIWKKQTLRNRTCILSANGVQTLSIPVIHTGGVKTAIKDIQISYDQDWTRVHKGAIFSAYNTSAFFSYFKDDLFAIYDQQPTHLLDFNQKILQFLLKKLKFKGRLEIYADQDVDIDYRQLDSLKSIQENNIILEKYNQVFGNKFEFVPHLSVLDVLANLGRI
jgi:WbqC-like protein family